jgi:Uncharacterised nucleotidyltransferase
LFIVPSKESSDTIQPSDEVRWAALQSRVNEARIAEAFRVFHEGGLRPILIKGWAAARLYPPSRVRSYTDIDLGVCSAELDSARALLADDVVRSRLNIDLHDEFRHLDSVDWDVLFDNSELVDIGGTEIRILSPEDHLRVLCVHWLTDSGAHKDRLWDIYYAVDSRGRDFDWDKCLLRVSETRRKWIICTIGLAHKYLGLNIDDLPFAESARNPPAWLIRSVEREWRLGVQLRGLYDSVHDWKAFVAQLKKRIPPNPVYATVECEGEFDEGSRIPYQLKSLLKRAVPAVRKIALSITIDSGKNAK